MKVFICWSGKRSQAMAEALREWIPDVIQGVKPWMSEKDIHAGSRWPQKLAEGLKDTDFGIVCLTPENLSDIWPHFEAGALSKSVEHSFVCPYLLDLKPTQVVGPLAQFQAKKADREGTLAILKSINTARGEEKLEDERLQKAFDTYWKVLEKRLKDVPPPSESHEAKREQADMVEELLGLVRGLTRSQEDTSIALEKIGKR